MQIYALDHNSHTVHAHAARRGIRYTCPECLREVRIRGGLRRQAHLPRSCGNSLHFARQILNASPDSIRASKNASSGADFTGTPLPHNWENSRCNMACPKVVFEVQVSPISSAEVLERNRDYAQAGYRVVWILHDRRFNHSRIRGAESGPSLFPPHYFTNINASGKGFFYDQYAHFQFKRRIHRTKRFPVSFNELLPSTLNNFHATSPKRVSGGHFLLRVICSNKTSTGHQLPQLTGVSICAAFSAQSTTSF